jgi:hypothetical protein
MVLCLVVTPTCLSLRCSVDLRAWKKTVSNRPMLVIRPIGHRWIGFSSSSEPFENRDIGDFLRTIGILLSYPESCEIGKESAIHFKIMV